MKASKSKKVTLESLSKQIEHGFRGAQAYTDTQVEGLARIVQNGFSELKASLVSKKEFSQSQEVVVDQFRLLDAEVKDIKIILKPTTIMVAEHERRIETLESRLEPVEQKVGIVRLRR